MHSSPAVEGQRVIYPRGEHARHLRRLSPWLLPLSWLYGAGVASARRVRLIDADRRRGDPHVVSVGNLEVGGSGKTPLCIHLLSTLAGQETRAAYVSRGYRSRSERGDGITVVAPQGETVAPVPGVRLLDRSDAGLAAEIGDEAAVVASRCPGTALLVGRDKREAVALAGRLCGASVVVMDDAFQSWAAHRDVDLVLVADPAAVAGGRLLPAGRLREEIDALARADAVIVPEEAMRAAGRLRPHIGVDVPVLPMWRRIALDDGDGAVATVAGLARPGGFEAMVAAAGCDVRLRIRFPDHHRYDASDIATVRALVERHRLGGVVVTEKDAVKLRNLDGADALPLRVARLDVGVGSGSELEEMLKPRRVAAASA